MPSFKVVLAGDGGVGKSVWMKRFTHALFEKKYIATIGVALVPITFQIRKSGNNVEGNKEEEGGESVSFSVWDTAGQEKFGGLRDGYYIGAQAGIVMFDTTSRLTYKNVPMWYRDIVRVAGDIPVILCGNKVDITDRKVKPKQITFHRKRNLMYYDMSVAANYHLIEPFQYLARKLLGDINISFTMTPDQLGPVEKPIAPEIIEAYEREIAESYSIPLHDDEDDGHFNPPPTFTPTTPLSFSELASLFSPKKEEPASPFSSFSSPSPSFNAPSNEEASHNSLSFDLSKLSFTMPVTPSAAANTAPAPGNAAASPLRFNFSTSSFSPSKDQHRQQQSFNATPTPSPSSSFGFNPSPAPSSSSLSGGEVQRLLKERDDRIDALEKEAVHLRRMLMKIATASNINIDDL